MGFRTAIELCERWLGRWHLIWLYGKKQEVVGAAMTVGAAALGFWDEIRELNPAWIILILAAAFALVMVGINQGLKLFDWWRRSGRASQSNSVAAAGPDRIPLIELKEIDLHQFLRFVGIDPMNPANRLPPLQNNAYEAFVKLRQLARDEKVRVKGRPGFKYASSYMSWKPAELIPSIYWRDAQIFCLDVLGKSDIINISTMPDDAIGTGKSKAFVYRGLTLIEDDVMAYFKKDEFSK